MTSEEEVLRLRKLVDELVLQHQLDLAEMARLRRNGEASQMDRKTGGGKKMIGIAIASFLLGYILASIFRVGRESDDE